MSDRERAAVARARRVVLPAPSHGAAALPQDAAIASGRAENTGVPCVRSDAGVFSRTAPNTWRGMSQAGWSSTQ